MEHPLRSAASLNSICPSKTRTSPTSCREPLRASLTPDPQCTHRRQQFSRRVSSLPKQKLSSLTLGTLSSRSNLYLHRPGPRKPQWLPVDCFVDESPAERSPLGGHSSLCDGMSLILRGSASWVPPAFASARDCCVSNQSMPRERSGCLLMLDSRQRATMPGRAQETRPPARAAWVCSVLHPRGSGSLGGGAVPCPGIATASEQRTVSGGTAPGPDE